jgi:hypothetical protein
MGQHLLPDRMSLPELMGDGCWIWMRSVTARGYRARWDDEQRQTVAEFAGVELTDPYAALLAEDTTDEAQGRHGHESPGKRQESPQKATLGAFLTPTFRST